MKYKIIKIKKSTPSEIEIKKHFLKGISISQNILDNIEEYNKLYFNIDKIKNSNKEFWFVYYCIDENNIPCGYFSHSYSQDKNNVYLSIAEVSKNYMSKGLGTKAYKIIKQDIIKVFKPSEITAFFVSESGERFGKKIGFKIFPAGMSNLKIKNMDLKLAKIKTILKKQNKNMTFEL